MAVEDYALMPALQEGRKKAIAERDSKNANRKEINNLFELVEKQVLELTGGKVSLVISKKTNWLVAIRNINTDTEAEDAAELVEHEVAAWIPHADGFPCSLIGPNSNDACANIGMLEKAFVKLLSDLYVSRLLLALEENDPVIAKLHSASVINDHNAKHPKNGVVDINEKPDLKVPAPLEAPAESLALRTV